MRESVRNIAGKAGVAGIAGVAGNTQKSVRVLSLTKDTLNLSCTKQSMTQSIGDYMMLMQ